MSGIAIVTINSSQWQVNVASSQSELLQGLSGLASLTPGTGMLFDFGGERSVTITTNEMLFPIDVAFINSYGVITEILRDYGPNESCTAIEPASYMLEVNSGELLDVSVGDIASAEYSSPSEVEPQNMLLVAIQAIVIIGSLVLQGTSMIKDILPGKTEGE